MLGVRSSAGLSFYEWDSLELIRRIEITPKNVYWSENGELVCISTDTAFFILKYNLNEIVNFKRNKDELLTEDGYEDAFEVIGEIQETIKTGLWVGDCFIYTNGVNRLNYYVGGEIVTVSHLDRPMYLLGYLSKENRLYLSDKELNVVSYSLLLSVLEYQTCVMRQDFDSADKILPAIPKEQRIRVAHFLEKQGFKRQALTVSTDPEHKFDLALQLKDTKIAYDLAVDAQTEFKWKQLAELALNLAQLDLAKECLEKAQDLAGLLLLATSCGNWQLVQRISEIASDKNMNNISFLSHFILGNKERALENLIQTDRLPEAAFFARTYLPSQVSRVISLWKESVTLKSKNEKTAQALADPFEYENLFPEFAKSLAAERYYKTHYESKPRAIASEYPNIKSNIERDLLAELGDGDFNLDEFRQLNSGLNNGLSSSKNKQLESAVNQLDNLRIDNEVNEDDDDEFGFKDD